MNYEPLINKFTKWAQAQPDIRAVIVVGSQARIDHPADEWADLDLQVFATDFSPYLSSTGWLAVCRRERQTVVSVSLQ